MNEFMKLLREQRWDDHRFYHQCRINQSLHLLSALSFLVAYALLFVDPAAAGLLGWGVSMVSRQAGHFFFEPRGYDRVNDVSFQYKEDVKVGYNLRRKVVLMGIWVAVPVLLAVSPSLFGLIEPAGETGGLVSGYWHDVGIFWLALGVGGLLFRTVHLFFLQGVMAGLCWMSKILTDPVHDVMLYWKSPFYLLRGQRLDPMEHVAEHEPEAEDVSLT
ncbi:hypothetical protein [Ideonella dechloratans]|uniref:hypothetical protein n=1 Tax=Ideonella dechloratans TaxID=36863 RepID=UPI0035B30D51